MKSNKDFDTQELERNIFRIFYVFKRALDEWGEQHINQLGNPQFHITYMPFFMNIGLSGISNNELAIRMGVTKQGASRIVKGLVASGFVRAEKSNSDGRSSMLNLTENGEKFYAEAQEKLKMLESQYIKESGVRNYTSMVDTLLKLIKFHNENSY